MGIIIPKDVWFQQTFPKKNMVFFNGGKFAQFYHKFVQWVKFAFLFRVEVLFVGFCGLEFELNSIYNISSRVFLRQSPKHLGSPPKISPVLAFPHVKRT